MRKMTGSWKTQWIRRRSKANANALDGDLSYETAHADKSESWSLRNMCPETGQHKSGKLQTRRSYAGALLLHTGALRAVRRYAMALLAAVLMLSAAPAFSASASEASKTGTLQVQVPAEAEGIRLQTVLPWPLR